MELEEGEILCDECGGLKEFENGVKTTKWFCSRCLNTGKLTWTEKITGKRMQSGLIYAPYMPVTIIPDNYLATAISKESVERIAKMLGFEKPCEDVIEYKEDIVKWLKKN